MIHKTNAFVLKSLKYGETSLIVTMFTELFGVQSYLVNGIRTEKKGGTKAGMYQPGSLLSLEVYHQDGKSLQRVKEAGYLKLMHGNNSHALKNSIVLFMSELLLKCLKHPEQNESLFHFMQTSLEQLDQSEGKAITLFPLYFALKLPQHLGFGIECLQGKQQMGFLDLESGSFTDELPIHSRFLSGDAALAAGELLKEKSERQAFSIPDTADALKTFMSFYSIHVPEFGELRSLAFLLELLS